jgi:hypothetical protein
VNVRLEEEEKLQKANSYNKKKIVEEKRMAAAVAKEEIERVKADKAAERAHQKEAKEAQNMEKVLQSFQRVSAKHNAHLNQRPSVRNV